MPHRALNMPQVVPSKHLGFIQVTSSKCLHSWAQSPFTHNTFHYLKITLWNEIVCLYLIPQEKCHLPQYRDILFLGHPWIPSICRSPGTEWTWDKLWEEGHVKWSKPLVREYILRVCTVLLPSHNLITTTNSYHHLHFTQKEVMDPRG